jgi:murein DD-endopeptidase MepM/ murein hydrolase activator NlpD
LHKTQSGLDRLLGHLGLQETSTDGSEEGGAAEQSARMREAAAGLTRWTRLDRLVPIAVCGLLVIAAVVSAVPGGSAVSAAPRGTAPVVVGAVAPAAQYGHGDGPAAVDYSDLYLGDGSIPNTLQNPAVGTDAKTLLRTYAVRGGDTLGAIAGRFGLATSTIYWANQAQLPNPASIRVGQKLLIPPVDGLLVKVAPKTTLASLATTYKITPQDIIDANNLPEQTLSLNETLIIPGASGGSVPKTKGTSSSSRAPRIIGWLWPVGGNNFISQFYWAGHHAVDIAAPKGTAVYAAVSGTVVFTGWKSDSGGGNMIWVMEGTKLYTTYNHLSAIGVHKGQHVSAGQRIGSVGMTGNATGPHLHFEVWLGSPYGLGNDSDAVNPCRYLAGC